MNDIDIESLKGVAQQLRIHSIAATTAAGSGHPALCCSDAPNENPISGLALAAPLMGQFGNCPLPARQAGHAGGETIQHHQAVKQSIRLRPKSADGSFPIIQAIEETTILALHHVGRMAIGAGERGLAKR
jgi:hypothetical protein